MHSAAMARLELDGAPAAGHRRRTVRASSTSRSQWPAGTASCRSRRCCAGSIRCAASSRRPTSSRSRRRTASSSTSAGGCCGRHRCAPRSGNVTSPRSPPTISVNLSARQITDPQFVGDVRAVLATTGLAPSSLTLEITESALIGDPDVAAMRLHEIKSTGVRLAIDDFGTGYSSLSSLQSLPVDTLKIDKAFIDRITSSPEAAGLVKAIRGSRARSSSPPWPRASSMPSSSNGCSNSAATRFRASTWRVRCR